MILIVSPNVLLVRGLKAWLEHALEAKVVPVVASAHEFPELVRHQTPDVVLLDCTGSSLMDGAVIQHVLREFPALQVIGLNQHNNHLHIFSDLQCRLGDAAHLLWWLQQNQALDGK